MVYDKLGVKSVIEKEMNSVNYNTDLVGLQKYQFFTN